MASTPLDGKTMKKHYEVAGTKENDEEVRGDNAFE